MAGANKREEMTPEEDAANTKLRLLLLNEKLNKLKGEIEWEIQSFYLRNPDSMIE